MPIETATYINDLVITNPAASDGLNQADDHMRLIKAVLKNTFPGAVGPITAATGPNGVQGAVVAPAYGFTGEPTLGLVRQGPGQIAVVGGTLLGSIPIGGLLQYAGTNAPTSFLVCDGQLVSRTTYAALFAAIGTTWGAGDGTTTFAVPDLMSRFLRHRENAGAAGAVGNKQASTNKEHTHNVTGVIAPDPGNHTHHFEGQTGGMSRNTDHDHGLPNDLIRAGNFGNQNGGGNFGVVLSTSRTDRTNTDHDHHISGDTGTASANHSHTIAITAANQGDSVEARPLSATVLTCIRAL